MIEGLKACCGKDRFTELFPFNMGGKTWVAACNGHAMAAIQTDDPEAIAAATGSPIGNVETVLTSAEKGDAVSVAALRAWCHEAPRTKPCPDCNGTRRLTCSECKGTGRAEHDCDCGHCHVDDDGPCDECGGVGAYDCEECDNGTVEVEDPGVIACVVVNRALLAKVLASAPGETVLMLRDGDRLNFEAPWWRGAVMRLRWDPEGLSVFCGPAADDSPRDKIVRPRMGDWFFDAHGWVRRVDHVQPGVVTYTAYCSIGEGKAEHAVTTKWPWLCAEYGLRPMTPGEVEAFERDGTRPESAR